MSGLIFVNFCYFEGSVTSCDLKKARLAMGPIILLRNQFAKGLATVVL